MKASDIDTKDAGKYAWAAARDARIRNYANSSLYTEEQKIKAERMKLVLEMLYTAKSTHINYRKTFITIKLESPVVRDRKNLKDIEATWDSEGITKCISNQGVVYRIKK